MTGHRLRRSPVPRPYRPNSRLSSALRAVLALAVLSGCIATTDPRDVERSRRQLALASSMYNDQNDVPGALATLETALELDPGNAEAHVLLGYIELGLGNLDEAESSARRGVQILEVRVGGERSDLAGAQSLAEARNILGLVLIAQQRYDEAVEVLQASADDAMNRAPHLAYGNLGLAYLRAGRPDDALGPLQASVERQPRFCVGHHRLGEAYFALNRLEEAEGALDEALGADERCEVLQGAWRLRGEVRARRGDALGAVADLEKCAELAPRSEDGEACAGMLRALEDRPAGASSDARLPATSRRAA